MVKPVPASLGKSRQIFSRLSALINSRAWETDCDAGDVYNDFAFALSANVGYLSRERPSADLRMGDATKIWEAA